MIPMTGETVHYVSYGTPGGEYGRECRAAIVTEAGPLASPQLLGLAVLNPTGIFFGRDIPQDEGYLMPKASATSLCAGQNCRGGTWHHPLRTREAAELLLPPPPPVSPTATLTSTPQGEPS